MSNYFSHLVKWRDPVISKITRQGHNKATHFRPIKPDIRCIKLSLAKIAQKINYVQVVVQRMAKHVLTKNKKNNNFGLVNRL